MIIREYMDSDWLSVTDLLVQLQAHLVSVDDEEVQVLLSKYHSEYLNRLLAILAENNGKLFVATNHGSIIGIVAGIIEPEDEEDRLTNRCPKRGKVLELVVDKNARSKGTGVSLLRMLETYFAEQHCEFVFVDVFAPNTGALSFYKKNLYAPRNIEMYKRIDIGAQMKESSALE